MIIIISIVVLAAIAGLFWAHYNYQKVAMITVNSSVGLSEDDEHRIDAMSVPEIGKIIA